MDAIMVIFCAVYQMMALYFYNKQ